MQIFVNLPVRDLDRSVQFFSHLGFEFDPKFTDEKATCMIVDDDIYVMLLVEKFFETFTKKEVADARKSTEVLVALSVDSREAVDTMVNNALKAGGSAPNDKQDHGWMYGWGFEDPDGHLWEVFYADENAMPEEE